ncbi:MAG: hypothetical protein MRZ82_05420 [Firmicutes bacterium]|nr:hypothetical protein [Bacillota bacterium]
MVYSAQDILHCTFAGAMHIYSKLIPRVLYRRNNERYQDTPCYGQTQDPEPGFCPQGSGQHLVFYPNDTHVGIVVGWDESGNILIVHCASGYNTEAVHISLAIVLLIMYNFLNQTCRVEAKDSPKREVCGLFLAYGT